MDPGAGSVARAAAVKAELEVIFSSASWSAASPEAALGDDSGDNQARLRHRPTVRPGYSDVLRHAICICAAGHRRSTVSGLGRSTVSPV